MISIHVIELVFAKVILTVRFQFFFICVKLESFSVEKILIIMYFVGKQWMVRMFVVPPHIHMSKTSITGEGDRAVRIVDSTGQVGPQSMSRTWLETPLGG